jgi:hypothetical protein
VHYTATPSPEGNVRAKGVRGIDKSDRNEDCSHRKVGPSRRKEIARLSRALKRLLVKGEFIYIEKVR